METALTLVKELREEMILLRKNLKEKSEELEKKDDLKMTKKSQNMKKIIVCISILKGSNKKTYISVERDKGIEKYKTRLFQQGKGGFVNFYAEKIYTEVSLASLKRIRTLIKNRKQYGITLYTVVSTNLLGICLLRETITRPEMLRWLEIPEPDRDLFRISTIEV